MLLAVAVLLAVAGCWANANEAQRSLPLLLNEAPSDHADFIESQRSAAMIQLPGQRMLVLSPSPSVNPTVSPSPSFSPSTTVSRSSSASASASTTASATSSPTPSMSPTASISATQTSSASANYTSAATVSTSASNTASPSLSSSFSASPLAPEGRIATDTSLTGNDLVLVACLGGAAGLFLLTTLIFCALYFRVTCRHKVTLAPKLPKHHHGMGLAVVELPSHGKGGNSPGTGAPRLGRRPSMEVRSQGVDHVIVTSIRYQDLSDVDPVEVKRDSTEKAGIQPVNSSGLATMSAEWKPKRSLWPAFMRPLARTSTTSVAGSIQHRMDNPMMST